MSFLKKIVKTSLHSIGYYSALYRFRRPESHRLLILMYHDFNRDRIKRVSPTEPDAPSEREFASHIKALKNRFRVLSLEDIAKELHMEGQLKEPTAAITFDDGFLSNFEIAFPLLKHESLVATVFLTTDWINRKMVFWWHDLVFILRKLELSAAAISVIEDSIGTRIPSNIPLQNDNSVEHKLLLTRFLESHFRSLNNDEVLRIIRILREKLLSEPTETAGSVEPLSWEQIREMADYGIRFGAHTVTHSNLSHMTIEEGMSEIIKSRNEIHSKVNTEVTGFAFPYGMDVENYKRFGPLLKENGFSYAVSALFGNNDSQCDRYRLSRISLPYSDSLAEADRYLVLSYLEDLPNI